MPQLVNDKIWLKFFFRLSLLMVICLYLLASLREWGFLGWFDAGINLSFGRFGAKLPFLSVDGLNIWFPRISFLILGTFTFLLWLPINKNGLTRHIFKVPVILISSVFFISLLTTFPVFGALLPHARDAEFMHRIFTLIMLGLVLYASYKSYLMSHDNRKAFLMPPPPFYLKFALNSLLLIAIIYIIWGYLVNRYGAEYLCRGVLSCEQIGGGQQSHSFEEFLVISYRYFGFVFLSAALITQVSARRLYLKRAISLSIRVLPTFIALKILLGIAHLALDKVKPLIWFDYVLGLVIFGLCVYLVFSAVLVILPLKSSVPVMPTAASLKNRRSHNSKPIPH